MAYSVLLILAAAYPRRRDHFLEDQPLKLHIIKTCAEWTIGIQPRDLNESHWIVKGESNGDRKHGVLPKAKTVPKHNARVSNCITQRLFWPSIVASRTVIDGSRVFLDLVRQIPCPFVQKPQPPYTTVRAAEVT